MHVVCSLPSREVDDVTPADSPERVARNWRNIDKKIIYITPALSFTKELTNIEVVGLYIGLKDP
jgi:hypothetical protein